MKAHDLFELATRNLRESKLRNSLTTLGIAVGVASLVAMLALGVGLQQLAGRRLERSGLFDTVFVFSRREVASFDRAERRANPVSEEARPLDEDARAEIQKLPNVIEAYPETRLGAEARFNEKSQFITVMGLPPSARESEALEQMTGKFFSAPGADEAILLLEFAKTLNPKTDSLLGQELTIRYMERQSGGSGGTGGSPSESPATEGEPTFSIVRRERNLRIVGIIETEPFGGFRNFTRGRVFIPIALGEQLTALQPTSLRDALRGLPEKRNYSNLSVRTTGPMAVQAIQDKIKQMGFTTWSILDATRNMRRFFAVLDIFLGIFGSLALAVASLGIINTLVMAILERRREIGIMKAIGASDGDVKTLFFVEAGAMGLLGGVSGVLLGWAIGSAINFGTNIYLERQALPPEKVWAAPWWLVLGAIGFSILVSLLAGLYPASRAAKLDPVQALRYE